jgi:uncharacterized protein (DUF302 family)
MQYGISKNVSYTYDEAITKVTEELKKEGFGVLTTIDVKETLKKKLDVDIPRYIILGACNPPFAHKAIQTEQEIGLLLPCNVLVYEKDSTVVVSAFNPSVMNAVVDNPAMQPIADDIRQRLERVMAAM